MNVFFSILGNQDFTDLSLIENYSALLILKNLGFEKELTQLSESILLWSKRVKILLRSI